MSNYLYAFESHNEIALEDFNLIRSPIKKKEECFSK